VTGPDHAPELAAWSSARRRTLLEAAVSEAKRFDHSGVAPAHLAIVLARDAPEAFERRFGAGAEARLEAALRSAAPVAVEPLALLAGCVSDDVEAVLDHLAGRVPELVARRQLARAHAAWPGRRDGGDPPAAAWRPGDVIAGTYEVLALVGAGRTTVVHRVRHRTWAVDLAVKSPRPDRLQSERLRADFEAEAATWIGLGLHPHVCACHYVRRLDGFPRVFAEYVEGGSLADRIDDRSVYEDRRDTVLARLLGIARHVARGLAHAHAHGVVHQDVKPANVLLAPGWEAKVADFGVARAGVVAGSTLPYRSPEQALQSAAAPALTPATDAWSFAVTVMELFAGEVVVADGVDAPSALDRLEAHDSRRTAIPALPPALAAVLRECLRMDPAARPPMADVAAAVEGVAGAGDTKPAPRPAELLAGEESNRALALFDLGREDDARRHLERALAQDPHNPEATYNLGLQLWRRGEIPDDELVRRLEAVAESQPAAVEPRRLLELVERERAAVSVERLKAVAEADWRDAASPVAVIADGAVALIGNRCGARVWELASGACVGALARPEHEWATAVALSADGGLALVGFDGGAVDLWDWRRRQARQLEGPTGHILSVALQPDGRLAIAGAGSEARVWDATGRLVRTLADRDRLLMAVGFADGGRAGLTLAHDGTLAVWDLTSGGYPRAFETHGSAVWCMATDAAGRVALTGSADATGALWRLEDGQRLAELSSGGGHILAVALTGDASIAVTADDAGTVRIWELPAGRCRRTLETGATSINSLALTRDGRTLVVGGSFHDRAITRYAEVWRLHHEAPHTSPWAYTRPRRARDAERAVARLRLSLTAVDALVDAGRTGDAVNRLRELRATPGYERHPEVLALWRRVRARTGRGRLRAAWPCRVIDAGGRTSALAMSADASVALVARSDRVVLWDLERGAPRLQWWRAYATVALTPDGRVALIGGERRDAELWELAENGARCVQQLSVELASLDAAALTHDGALALTAPWEGPPRLWDVRAGGTGTCLHVFEGEQRPVALAADGRLVITTADAQAAHVWELAGPRPRPVGVLDDDRRFIAIDSVAVASDGNWIATSRPGPGLRIWDAATLDQRAAVRDASEAVALSDDGHVALTRHADDNVRIWDVRTGLCLHVLGGHAGTVAAVALTPDAGHALSSDGSTLRLWELDWDLAPR